MFKDLRKINHIRLFLNLREYKHQIIRNSCNNICTIQQQYVTFLTIIQYRY